MSALPRPTLTIRKGDRLAELNDAQRSEVERRRSIVRSWQNMVRDFRNSGRPEKEATSTFLLGHPDLSRARLYRWQARLQGDDPADVLDGRSKAARSRVDNAKESCSPEAWNMFKGIWLTIHRRPIAVCHQIVAYEAESRGWAWPTLRTIQLRCQQIEPIKRDHFRMSEREWNRIYVPKLWRDYEQYRSGEWWVGDAHQWDVFCRRSESDRTIVRPTLVSFIDLRSRVCVGWHIGEHETSDAILLATRMGCQDYGIPDHWCVDNGKPYRADGVTGGRPTSKRKLDDPDYVKSVLGGLDCMAHFCIPFNPDSKPIEPWHETIESQFGSTFATYCGGMKDDRFRAAHKLANDHPELAPTVDQLRDKFGRYLQAYHATPHRGHGMHGLSPAKAFETFDPIARKIAPDGALDLLLMRTVKPASVTSAGVCYMGDYYGQRMDELMLRIGQKLPLRVHPTDASYVVVCEPDGKPICRAYNNRRLYSGTTQENIADGMRARKRARLLAKSIKEGALKPLLQDVTEAAIAARLAAGQAAQKQAELKTGTSDAPVRGVRPLRSDWTEAMDRFNRSDIRTRAMPPSEPSAQSADPSLETLADALDEANPFGADVPDIDLADVDLD